MAFVLVHGGGFAGSCWERLVPRLDGEVHAVDLPGRGSRPAELSTVTVADYVSAVVSEIEDADLRDVVLVGHSLAGITLPGVTARVPDRLRRLVFVSASVPDQGTSMIDVLSTFGPTATLVADQLGADVVTPDGTLHPHLATAMFCNEMDDEQRAFTLERMVPEPFRVITEPVDLRGLQQPVPRTYVRLLRDQSLSVETQDRFIGNLGEADVIDLDTSHMAMVTDPAGLAAILNSF
jgi:pimeloyl-ACP methyl ester carboxylesterase